MKEYIETTESVTPPQKIFFWSAVIMGALVGVGLSFLLNLLNLAVGLSAFNVSPEGVTTIAIGGFIGVLIASIVIMFVMGWVAGYLGKYYGIYRHFGILYGFLAWSLSLIMTIILTTHSSNFISSYYPNAIVREVQTKTLTEATQTKNKLAAQTNLSDTNLMQASAFGVFILFFSGALASCLGGYCGYKPREKE